MLEIRQSQLELLTQQRMERFVTRMCEHARRHFPDEVAELEDSELRGAVDRAILVGRRYGLTTSRDLCRFLNLSIASYGSLEHDSAMSRVFKSSDISTPSLKLQRAYALWMRRLQVWEENRRLAGSEGE